MCGLIMVRLAGVTVTFASVITRNLSMSQKKMISYFNSPKKNSKEFSAYIVLLTIGDVPLPKMNPPGWIVLPLWPLMFSRRV
jgi:hypothetical protein